MACDSPMTTAPVLLWLGCLVLPALTARDPLEHTKSIEPASVGNQASTGARHAATAAVSTSPQSLTVAARGSARVTLAPSPSSASMAKDSPEDRRAATAAASTSPQALAVAARGPARVTVPQNASSGSMAKDASPMAQTLGAAISALTNAGTSAESSDIFVENEESLVEETADVHRSVAQLLGIVDGDLCPHVAAGQKHGCHLGCHCGLLQRCFSKPYVGLGTGLAASNSTGDEAQGKVDVGICRMSEPALMSILAAVSLTVFIGMLLLRQSRAHPNAALADRPNVSRAALESRLRSTALTAKQRQAILDQFCGNESNAELQDKLKEPNFISVAAFPLKHIIKGADDDSKSERVAGTGGTASSDSDTSDTD